MKEFDFPPEYFIGWIWIAWPGSILGPQQQFLVKSEKYYLKTRIKYDDENSSVYRKHKNEDRYEFDQWLQMSPDDKKKSLYGDKT